MHKPVNIQTMFVLMYITDTMYNSKVCKVLYPPTL